MPRSEDVATTTVGLAGVGGAAALRHHALELAYEGKPRPNLPRVNLPLFHERRLLTPGVRGRGVYLTGAALGALSTPTAAVGINRMVTGKPRRKPREDASKRDDHQRPTFLEAGLGGAKEAVVERANTATNPAPAQLVAGNYLAGLGIASTAGGLAHLAMRKAPLPGHAKAAIAGATGTSAGALSLPAQSALTRRASGDEYEVTATGVRRRKKKRKPASSQASVHEGRARYGGDPRRFRSETVPGGVGKRSSRGQSATHGSRVAKAEKQMTARERKRLAHQKQASAALSMTAGTAGLAALGITLGGKHPRVKPLKPHLPAILATGAGVGGANAFLGAHIQQREAKQQLAPLPRRTVVIVKPDEEASKGLPLKRARITAVYPSTPLRRGYIGHWTPGSGRVAPRPDDPHRSAGVPLQAFVGGRHAKVGSQAESKVADEIERRHVPGGQKTLTDRWHKLSGAYRTSEHLEGPRSLHHGLGRLDSTYVPVHRRRRVQATAAVASVPVVTVAVARANRPKRETASKAFGLRLRPTGFRRAPAMRMGTIRQTRYPGGKIRVSTVRGGLA